MGTKHHEITERFAAKIEMRPLAFFKPYANNSRTHSADQIAQIAASITEFGFVNPVLARGDGTLIAGHGRIEAATKLKLDDVPVIIIDHLTDTQVKALVIADNKIAENAGWDEEKLAEELAALELKGFNLDLTGFDEDELEDILGTEDGENEAPPPAAAEKSEFKDVTYTFHKKQLDKVKAAVRAAIKAGPFRDGLNENDTGNALARICEAYLSDTRAAGRAQKETAPKKKQGAKKGKA